MTWFFHFLLFPHWVQSTLLFVLFFFLSFWFKATKTHILIILLLFFQVSVLKCSTLSQLNTKVLSRREKNWELSCPCRKCILAYNLMYILKTVTWLILLCTYKWKTTRSSKERATVSKSGYKSCCSRNLCSKRNRINARKKTTFWFQLIPTLMFWMSIWFLRTDLSVTYGFWGVSCLRISQPWIQRINKHRNSNCSRWHFWPF